MAASCWESADVCMSPSAGGQVLKGNGRPCNNIDTYTEVATARRVGRSQDVKVHIDVDRSLPGGVSGEKGSLLLFGEGLGDLELLGGGTRGTAGALSSRDAGSGEASKEDRSDLHIELECKKLRVDGRGGDDSQTCPRSTRSTPGLYTRFQS